VVYIITLANVDVFTIKGRTQNFLMTFFNRMRSNSDMSYSENHSLFAGFPSVHEEALFPSIGSPIHVSQSLPSGFPDLIESDHDRFFKQDDTSPFSDPSSGFRSSDTLQIRTESSSEEEPLENESGFEPIELITDEAYRELSAIRPWEQVPLEEVNAVPAMFESILQSLKGENLRFGAFRELLRFYIIQSVQNLKLSEAQESRFTKAINNKLTNPELIQYAESLGLFPLAARLHLECQGVLIPPRPRELFLVYKREKRRRRKRVSQIRSHVIANSTRVSAEGTETIEYYPGIELKLGKERDTVIRPMVTSVFRSNRDSFKSALLSVGLKYGELRMWKDAQLCTALHVADKYRPGIWDKAVELHLKKSSRAGRGSIPRQRAKPGIDEPYSHR
jgi:hypothetical protein